MTASPVAAEPRVYDFRAAAPLASECAAAVAAFQLRLAAALRAILTPQLREVVDAEPAAVELRSDEGAVAYFAQPGVRYRIILGDSGSAIAMLDFSLNLANRIVDRLCGGADNANGEPRSLSGIEQALLSELLTRALPTLAEAFRGLLPVLPRELAYAANVNASALAGPGDHVALVPLDLRSGPVEGRCTIVLPLTLVTGTAPATTGGSGDEALVRQHLLAVEVPVTARIAFQVAALDIATLREGTVIPTGHPSHGTVEITTGGQRRFIGMLGREQEHVAVRVMREATEDESLHRPNRRKQAP